MSEARERHRRSDGKEGEGGLGGGRSGETHRPAPQMQSDECGSLRPREKLTARPSHVSGAWEKVRFIGAASRPRVSI